MVSECDKEIALEVKGVKTEIENFITFYTGSDDAERKLMLHVLRIYIPEAYSNIA